MAPLYTKALVVGATSGIGLALAARLVETGTKVVVAGRRRDRLEAFVETHGAHNASAIDLDVTNLPAIGAVAGRVAREHPDLDCVIVNAGIQRAFDFARPESVDLVEFSKELTTNYLSAVHLTAAFLPQLKVQKRGHLVYVSATLGLIPSMVRTPNYNASKAALHAFIMDVREQLRDAGQDNVRMVEVFPPAVQTELHDERFQPDLVNGGEIGMPLREYIDRMYEGLERGEDQFAIGPGEKLLEEGGWETERQRLFAVQRVAIQNSLAKYVQK